ncbi:hypothetical protein JW868_03750 [Candidatus Woesearchaeota archaeon]|nr:hypothetical protein [Candidatus Woesearchaeota archaeon]
MRLLWRRLTAQERLVGFNPPDVSPAQRTAHIVAEGCFRGNPYMIVVQYHFSYNQP